MQYLRYNTDSQEVVFGIFVDSTDGNTEETGLTIANTDIKIWKAGATTLTNKNSGGATHISNGIYYATFDSTDTNTLGSGKAFVHVSGALYTILEFCVLPQKVYDSMIAGSDNLEVDTIQVEGSDATDQINSACDTAISDAGVTTTRMGYVDYLANATYGLSAIENLVDEIESRLTAQRAGYIDNLSGGAVALASGVTVTTNNDKTGYSLTVTPPTSAQIRTEIDSNSTQLSGIKAKTDALTFTTPNKVDATATVSTTGLATEAKQDTMITHLTDIKGSTFSGSTDSLEAIRDRGDLAWITGGGMSGSNTITLTIQDEDSNNIVETSVEIYDSAGTTFYEKKFSNSSGQAVFQGDDGTYIIKCHKAGYSFENTSLTVSGNTNENITGTAFVMTPSSDPDICRVYTILRDGLSFPTTATGTWTPYGTIEIDNTYYSDSDTSGTYTPGTGVIYFDIPKNTVVTISIPDYITGVYEIPSTDTAELSELNQKP